MKNVCKSCKNAANKYGYTTGTCDECYPNDAINFDPIYTLADLQAAREEGARANKQLTIARLREAFVKGAKFWEFYSTGGTMWQSDQHIVGDEAEKRYPADSPIETRAEIEAKERERCVEALVDVLTGQALRSAIDAIAEEK